jgi:hypothetical protein
MKVVLAVLVLVAVSLSAGAQDRFEELLAETTRDRMQQLLDAACNTEALKKDRVACAERKIEVLAGHVQALQKDLPRMIERGVKAALEPRVFRNAAPEAR